MIPAIAIVPLFVATAIAEITGCYLVFLWLRQGRSPLLLVGAALSLAIFTWLLSLPPHCGVYVTCAVLWGWLVEQKPPDRWDLIGAAVCLTGMAIIAFGPHR